MIRSAVDIGSVRRLAGPARLPGGDGTLTVGACGTADEGKGADLWLEMAAEVLRRGGAGSVRFVWVGRPQLADLDHRLDTLGLWDYVEFAGDLANPYPIMAAMDVFTHPARQDAFPLAVIEAMVLGRPVVAFDVGGLADQLGDAGCLVPAGDVAAMAAAVVELAADAEQRRRLGDQGQERAVRSFGIEGFRSAIAAFAIDPKGGGMRPGAGTRPRSGPSPP